MHTNHYLCGPCWKYFECVHNDPDNIIGYCPICDRPMFASPGSLEHMKKMMRLTKSECSDLKVTKFKEY